MADMSIDEESDLVVCEDCGSDLAEEDSSYDLPDGRSLCADCAVARGGVHDGASDRWVRAPDLDGLHLEPG